MEDQLTAEELGKILNEEMYEVWGLNLNEADAYDNCLNSATQKILTYISDNYVRRDGVAHDKLNVPTEVKLDNGGTQHG